MKLIFLFTHKYTPSKTNVFYVANFFIDYFISFKRDVMYKKRSKDSQKDVGIQYKLGMLYTF